MPELPASARISLLAVFAMGLSACSSVPMAVITEKGRTFRGSLNASLPLSFQFSDGRVTCSGKFPSIVPGHTKSYTLPVVCNRGLTGIMIFADIDNLAQGGGGIIRLSDGTAGTFITGDAAAAL